MTIYSDIYNNLNMPTPGSAGGNGTPVAGVPQLALPGAGTFSADQVAQFINQNPADVVLNAANTYGVSPSTLAGLYNYATGQNYTPEQAYSYFGQTAPANLSIPTGVYPTSSSTSGGSSLSGIDWNSAIGKTLLPLLQKAATDLPGLTSQLPGALQGQYENLMRTALGPDAFQGTLNNLASRNVLNSSVASDALSKTASNISNQVGQAGYNSFLNGLQAQLGLGSNLAGLAQLGQKSRSSSSGSSSSSNPLAPYQLYQNYLLS